MTGLALPLRFALRELRGGLAGLRLLAVCLFLGTMAIAAVGSLSAAILEAIRAEGQVILGGDIEIRLPFRAATPAEARAFADTGTVSHASRMRAMATSGDRRSLAELKAVDTRYPLYGAATLADGRPVQAALAEGAVLAPELADQLMVRPGGQVTVGTLTLPVAGILGQEPDRAGAGFALGPTIMIARDRLGETGLVQVGSIITQAYRIRLGPGVEPGPVIADLKARFPGNDWEVRDRGDGAPGLRRFIVQLGGFLTLVGLAALAVAGVGVGQGVTAYMASKLRVVATMKTLGASTAQITWSYLLQITIVALGAVSVGAAAGALAPWAAVRLLGDVLPVPPAVGIYPAPLLLAAAYGLLVAFAFALWPLSRAAHAAPARLLRSGIEAPGRPSPRIGLLAALCGIAVIALAVVSARAPEFAASFIGGVLGLIALLTLFALLLRALARRLPRPRDPLARLALSSLSRPGSPAPQLIVALGLGLAIFATLAVIESSLSNEIARNLPEDAPDLVVFDAPKEARGPIEAAVAAAAPGARVNAAASLRGPVTAVKGVPVNRIVRPEGAWVLDGDRGLTFSDTPPEGNEVVAGKWWAADYSGPPLVSMDAEQAKLIGLKLGDRITIAVLGAEVEATIANFRELDFRKPTLQYMFVFNRAAIEAAPHSWVMTLSLPRGVDEAAVKRALAKAAPTASVVDVGETVERVNGLLSQVLTAIRAAAAAAIAAGVAVLIGALAASARARTYDSVLMKVLGATRGQILKASAIEYAVLGLVVAMLALLVGAGAGAGILAYALRIPFDPAWGQVAGTVIGGAALILVLGLAGAWRTLGERPSAILRTL